MSTRASVTCPQCGSLVPVGDRKCDNCGARQKDFAPAPQSYVRPDIEPVAPSAPTASAAPPRAPAPPAVTPPDDYRPLAHRGTGSGQATPPRAAPVTGYAVPATTPSGPYSTPPADPYAKAPVAPYAPGSHAQGAPSRDAPTPSIYTAATDTDSPERSRSASRALILSLIPIGVNVVVFVLIWITIAIAGGVDNLDSEAVVGGFLLVGLSAILGGLANIVFFLLALVFGIIGLSQTAGRATTGRWRAVLALVIVGWHVLLAVGFLALAAN